MSVCSANCSAIPSKKRWASIFSIALRPSVSFPNLHAPATKRIAELLSTLQNLSNDELPVARAFSQFLNLTNVAEQYHSISPNGEAASNPEALAQLFSRLKDKSSATKSCSTRCRNFPSSWC